VRCRLVQADVHQLPFRRVVRYHRPFDARTPVRRR
jgi:hypothetical protein